LVLLIDNYDSFTYNLYDYILRCGMECRVFRNDELTLADIHSMDFQSAVISPGPCKPDSAGITNDFIKEFYNKKPLLGICLGHQALGQFFGADLIKAEKPVHGKTSQIFLENHPIFDGIQSPAEVMRYHSLILKNVNSPLDVIATTEQGEIMAIAHQSLPLAGMQFHPESVLTAAGLKMMQNWFKYIQLI
jgi:para-aminobenzoate synthetase component II